MKLISTKDVHEDGVKILVYGASGVGKTTLIKTAPNPFIISSESGLLSLSDVDIPACEVTTEKELKEAYEFALNSDYDTICLDSVSDIAESLLGEHKDKFSDGRAAYGATNDIVAKYIRKFIKIKGKNVYFTAKEAKSEINGVVVFQPSMPGNTLTTNIGYFFDLVLRLEASKKGGRILHTKASYTQVCKDRSGKLDEKEEYNLTTVFNKVKGE